MLFRSPRVDGIAVKFQAESAEQGTTIQQFVSCVGMK